ncbi:MAG: lasso peptide biosynthesis B2 protein, partial [Acidimicrobiales bacterium]
RVLGAARGAWWAARALRVARRGLGAEGVRVRLPAPPAGAGTARGVSVVLARRPATCLERAVVLQRWLAAQGRRHDVVIGVQGPSSNLAAHAWVEGVEAGGSDRFVELHRISPP